MGEWRDDVPSNLLDDVPNECGALAQVALGAGDTGLNNAGGGFLNMTNRESISFVVSIVCAEIGGTSRDPPRGETADDGELFFQRTWPLLMPTIRPERAGASLAIFETFLSKMGVMLLSLWLVGSRGESLSATAGWVRAKFWDVGVIPDRASAFRKAEAEIRRDALTSSSAGTCIM